MAIRGFDVRHPPREFFQRVQIIDTTKYFLFACRARSKMNRHLPQLLGIDRYA